MKRCGCCGSGWVAVVLATVVLYGYYYYCGSGSAVIPYGCSCGSGNDCSYDSVKSSKKMCIISILSMCMLLFLFVHMLSYSFFSPSCCGGGGLECNGAWKKETSVDYCL